MIASYLPRFALLAGLAFAGSAWSQDKVPEGFSKEDQVAPSERGSGVDPFDPDVGRPKYVQVQVEFVEMSHQKLTELLFLADPPSSDSTPLRKQVVELVKEGEAEILETMMIVARSGETATTEGIREFIYPTEYEPPEIPQKVTIPGKPDELSPEKLKLMWIG